jgi:ribosomal-protein-alanine N-acetyltransferase
MKMKSENIVLRRLTDDDAPHMAKLANNEKIFRNVRDAFPHPYTLADAIAFIDQCKNQDPINIFAIEYAGNYVGNIGLVPGSDVYRKSAEIGYFIGEPYWNKGIVTTALKLITDYCFHDRGMIRVFTGVFEYNTASMRVLEKCGFEKECIFKKAVIKQEKIWDEVRFSKINPEFLVEENH